VASHHLIDSYLSTLRRRLPAETADELADGLIETYRHQLAGNLPADVAARAAITEFGHPDLVTAAFIRQAPGRHLALVLLGIGPVVGTCWAAALIAAHAWTWPVPTPVRLAFGATLLASIAILVIAATSRRSYTRTRVAALGGFAVIALDAAMLGAVVLAAPVLVWPMAVAIPASVARFGLTVRALPHLFTR
jgi:hypothetical protein